MSLENTLIIIGLIVFPNIGGWLGSIVVLKNMKWLNQCVKKPSFYPPTFVFPIAWTLLYCGMGYASYLVYDELRPISNGFNRTALIAVALYLLQLVLNWLWCPIFFGYHSFSWSTVDLIATAIAAAACGYVFGTVQLVAGYIFIPYLVWLCFATYLNIALYELNRNPKIIATTASVGRV